MYAILISLALITLGPFLIMTSVALSPNYTILIFPVRFIPNPIGLENFHAIFGQTLVVRWMLNSTLVATTVTLSTIVTASMAGYAFARGDFVGKEFVFALFLGIMMMPGVVSMVPRFIIISRMHLVNTYWALILPHATSIFGTFMLRQYYTTIPKDYDDAALLDGASIFQIYSRVLLPQIKPALATLGTLIFLQQWNDFMYPLIITSRAEMRTLTVGLATMVREEGAAGIEMAGAVLTFLPTFVVYLFAQKHLIQGIALSGLKG